MNFQDSEPQPPPAHSSLGEILIMSSCLEVAVQLYLDGIARIEGRAPTSDATAEERLMHLLAFADGLADKALRNDFMRWMIRLHALAPTMRAVRHGRWLRDPRWGNVLMTAPPGVKDLGPRRWELSQLDEAASA